MGDKNLKTVEIHQGNFEQAIHILDIGFPWHGKSFWRVALSRIAELHRKHSIDSLGEMVVSNDRPVGVLLKIQHVAPSSEKRIINLSSWYIEPEHRWYAPRMLLKTLSDKNSIYTDFTPSPSVYALNSKLGFKTLSQETRVYFLPLTALSLSTAASIVDFHDLDPAHIDNETYQLMAHHVALNCLAIAVKTNGTYQPLIFSKQKFKNLPGARLIYSQDVISTHENLTCLSRHLLRKGIMALAAPTLNEDVKSSPFHIKRYDPLQVKGIWQQNILDQTFSETVLLSDI